MDWLDAEGNTAAEAISNAMYSAEYIIKRVYDIIENVFKECMDPDNFQRFMDQRSSQTPTWDHLFPKLKGWLYNQSLKNQQETIYSLIAMMLNLKTVPQSFDPCYRYYREELWIVLQQRLQDAKYLLQQPTSVDNTTISSLQK